MCVTDKMNHLVLCLSTSLSVFFLLSCVWVWLCVTMCCCCGCCACLCCHAESSCTMNALCEPKGHAVLNTSAWPTPQQQSSTIPSGFIFNTWNSSIPNIKHPSFNIWTHFWPWYCWERCLFTKWLKMTDMSNIKQYDLLIHACISVWITA